VVEQRQLGVGHRQADVAAVGGAVDRVAGGRRRGLGQAVALDDRAAGLLEPQLGGRSEDHTSELQSLRHLVCRLLLEKKKNNKHRSSTACLKTTIKKPVHRQNRFVQVIFHCLTTLLISQLVYYYQQPHRLCCLRGARV